MPAQTTSPRTKRMTRKTSPQLRPKPKSSPAIQHGSHTASSAANLRVTPPPRAASEVFTSLSESPAVDGTADVIVTSFGPQQLRKLASYSTTTSNGVQRSACHTEGGSSTPTKAPQHDLPSDSIGSLMSSPSTPPSFAQTRQYFCTSITTSSPTLSSSGRFGSSGGTPHRRVPSRDYSEPILSDVATAILMTGCSRFVVGGGCNGDTVNGDVTTALDTPHHSTTSATTGAVMSPVGGGTSGSSSAFGSAAPIPQGLTVEHKLDLLEYEHRQHVSERKHLADRIAELKALMGRSRSPSPVSPTFL